ncbi:MAG: threonine/serine exporter family protein [Bacillota bacterium]|nr:threonine/serine exporter family protein [Bacillota bacterium]
MILQAHEVPCLVEQLLNIGEVLFWSGGEIGRIEDTLKRLCMAYGSQHANIYVIPSYMALTVEFETLPACTMTRRIHKNDSFDLTRVEDLNTLCRQCSREPLPVEELALRVKAIMEKENKEWKLWIGSFLAVASLTIFFGGTLEDAIASIIGAFVILFADKRLSPITNSPVFGTFLVSFVGGLSVCLMGKNFPFLHIDKVMIGDIMILIPGVAITTAIRYSLGGDPLSGVEKLIKSLFFALGVAGGISMAMFLTGVM